MAETPDIALPQELADYSQFVSNIAPFPLPEPRIPEPSGAERRKFRTIWISDIHLGTKGCNSELLIDFLDHTDSETMYLVGDIIDGWRLKKKFYWPPEHNDIVWRILKRARRGTRIIYIPGNHDEMMRPFSGMNFGGVEIQRAAFHTTADGRRLMVLHGDEFDTIMLAHRWLAFLGDALYHVMMKLNGWVARVRSALGLPYWSISKAAKHKVKNAVEFISKYEEVVARAAAERGVDGVVFDPPRAGAKAQSEQLARSGVQRVVAVSCNPASFARDARILADGGFALEQVTPIDQFIYSPHIELVALFSR